MGVSAFCRDHCENYRIKQSLAGSESGVRLFHLWGGNQAIASRISIVSGKVKLDLNRFKAATSQVDFKPDLSRLCQSIDGTKNWVGDCSPELMTDEDRRDFFFLQLQNEVYEELQLMMTRFEY
ncbi:hypothetical protein HanXRQr2_Chr03g0110231 [Helianthus annuus]|uniref:Uncharacterized protein n=1 Tax=Helianthus annuus TaxID=4232 RepID=A0A9K3JFB6_HELAN|nr:hypothetical protein HanXRQr2_Chr03g0110231 [Helianthus annuus]KAJ0600743.1 hypothetical protein HanIR_Chr03g0120621 [Helianthus annuus]